MPPTQTEPPVTFQIAEEGEAIGTVKQFASRMNLSQPRVLSCLDESNTTSVMLPAADEEARLLILDPDGLEALLHCAAEGPLVASGRPGGETLVPLASRTSLHSSPDDS